MVCAFLYRLGSRNFILPPQQQALKHARQNGIGIAQQSPGSFLMDTELENFRLLTLPEAAQMLHVSKRTLQRMIKKSDLPAFKVGGQWRVRESRLSQWIRLREGFSDTTD